MSGGHGFPRRCDRREKEGAASMGEQMTIDEMQAVLSELMDELPEPLFEGLTGGVSLLPDVVEDPNARHNDLFIMGAYHRGGGMGCWITIHYGSFVRVYGQASPDYMRQRLREVLRHELRHHVEYRAGVHDLNMEDEAFMERYLARQGGGPEA